MKLVRRGSGGDTVSWISSSHRGTNSSLCATAIYNIHRRRWRLSSASDSSASAVAFASVDRLVLDVNVHERSAVTPGPARIQQGGPP